MIQSVIDSDFIVELNTKANQITPQALIDGYSDAAILYLTKFTNDISGEIKYVYSANQEIMNRFSRFQCLNLAGYWKYEFWEVYYRDLPSVLTALNSPSTEKIILPVLPENGIVQGLVAIGKMYAAELPGQEEVQYKEYNQPKTSNYIYNGQ